MRNKVVTPIDALLDPGVSAEEAFLFDEGTAVAPAEIVADSMFDGIADSPPESADYRPADIQGIACWNCSHFQRTGLDDDQMPVGICHIWEAKVNGGMTSDKFTADATMAQWPAHKHEGEEGPEANWVEEYSADAGHLIEFQFADDEIEKDEATGLIWKPILRTGEWPKTPSSKGIVNKALKVVRDGVSSAKDRIISLQEIKDNFDVGAYPYVPIPLTDEEHKEHKNLLRLNTGWVKKLKIREDDNGVAKLVAGMQFTEPDARGKVERQTYPDVSSGIYFGINRPNGKTFNAALNHVVITHKPFMDGLGGFEFSDDGDKPETVETLQLSDDPEGHKLEWPPVLTPEERKVRVQSAVDTLLSLPDVDGEGNSYTVDSIDGGTAVIASEIGEISWEVNFSLGDEGVVNLEPMDKWQPHEDVEASQEDEQSGEPAAAQEVTVPRNETPLQQARRRRSARLARLSKIEGGDSMSKVRDVSEVNFSDPEDAKRYAIELSEENSTLKRSTTDSDLEKRVEELKGLGFSEMPGALAYYRDVFLSDDSETAMVLLSHDDNGNETGRQSKTGTELIDGFIASIPTDKEGKILLSGQALDTGTTEAPPEGDEEDKDTKEKVEERTQGVADQLGVDLGGDTGKEK